MYIVYSGLSIGFRTRDSNLIGKKRLVWYGVAKLQKTLDLTLEKDTNYFRMA